MEADALMTDVDNADTPDVKRFIIAVDFGTTFSSVAYLGYTSETQVSRLGPQHVEGVDRYPNHPYANSLCHDVPTEIWYSQRPAVLPQRNQNTAAHQPPCQGDISEEEAEEDDDDDSSDSDTITLGGSENEAEAPSSDHINSDRGPASVVWGYGVQDQFREAEDDADFSRRLTRFKLILDDSDYTANVRNTLSESFMALKKLRIIDEDTDTIADYLEQLFRHTKRRLVDSECLTEASPIEFVLCVPAIWKAKAVRMMQVAMEKAIKNSELGTLSNGSIDNLYVVSEPEAAAEWVIAQKKTYLITDETFILLDAGGGTVDAITYTVDKQVPLRLLTEEVVPGGAMCGSSFINEEYEKLLVNKLKKQAYLERDGMTMAKIINGLIVDFEREGKKKMDEMYANGTKSFTVRIPGLREDKKKNFGSGKMILIRKEVKKLFKSCLDGVAQVMLEQLRMARQKGRHVKKVILMGGFGQSESLPKYLKQVLDEQNSGVQLVSSKLESHSVAAGAVMRALRKEDGPERILQSSYGFMRTERYGEHEAHFEQKPVLDKIDGLRYIQNTIDWFVKKGDVLASEAVIERKVEYTWALRRKKLEYTETLMVSDQYHKSHYGFDHPENKGAEVAGVIDVDLTSIKQYLRAVPSAKPGSPPYWKVNATLLIFVSGRNLRYEVRWPSADGEIIGVGQKSLAAAFRPGTE